MIFELEQIRSLALWDPWGTLCMLGEKKFETRSWQTDYRGPLVIHVAKKWDGHNAPFIYMEPFGSVLARHGYTEEKHFPLGCAVGVVDLKEIYPVEMVRDRLAIVSPQELAFGDYSDGRFAWRFVNPRLFPSPIPMRGHHTLFPPSSDVLAAVERLL